MRLRVRLRMRVAVRLRIGLGVGRDAHRPRAVAAQRAQHLGAQRFAQEEELGRRLRVATATTATAATASTTTTASAATTTTSAAAASTLFARRLGLLALGPLVLDGLAARAREAAQQRRVQVVHEQRVAVAQRLVEVLERRRRGERLRVVDLAREAARRGQQQLAEGL